jgi:hypothetical protein
MQRMLDSAQREPREYIQFMLHSSELMPGGSPNFPTPRSISRLYDDLEALFSASRDRFVGMTLTDYRNRWEAEHGSPKVGAASDNFDSLPPVSYHCQES